MSNPATAERTDSHYSHHQKGARQLLQTGKEHTHAHICFKYQQNVCLHISCVFVKTGIEFESGVQNYNIATILKLYVQFCLNIKKLGLV